MKYIKHFESFFKPNDDEDDVALELYDRISKDIDTKIIYRNYKAGIGGDYYEYEYNDNINIKVAKHNLSWRGYLQINNEVCSVKNSIINKFYKLLSEEYCRCTQASRVKRIKNSLPPEKDPEINI